MPAPDSVRTYFGVGSTVAIKDVAQAFEILTGQRFLTSVHSSSLFALLVELRHMHQTEGALGDPQRAKELLQDFISHAKAEGEQSCR